MSVNGTQITCSIAPNPTDADIMLDAKSVLSALGMGLEQENSGSYTARRSDGKYFTVTPGSAAAVVNGSSVTLGAAAYLNDGYFLMIPSEVLRLSFGAQVSADAASGLFSFGANITCTPSSDSYSAIPGGMLSVSTSPYGVSYSLSGIDADSDVQVYYRLNGYSSLDEGAYYHKCAAPVYMDGKFSGGFSASTPNRYYDIKIAVTKGGTTKEYATQKAAKTPPFTSKSYDEFVSRGSGLSLTATYENISYYYASGASDCEVYYRKSGESDWHKALSPYRDEYVTGGQFRGSIVNLDDGCEYEVKAVGLTNGATVGEATAKVTTKANEPTVARTVNLSDIYSGGSLTISGYHGSENAWVCIKNDGTAINAPAGVNEAVVINDCDYLILDGFNVTGGDKIGIKVMQNCDNIRISNSEISAWGRKGVLDRESGTYKLGGETPNDDAAVDIRHAGFVTVENCYIHAPRGTSNRWNGATWRTVHPCGPVGIYYMMNESVVIRNNRIIGDGQLFNDAIEGGPNGMLGGGPNADSDICGNLLSGGADDGAELDGSQMNVRFYDNTVTDFLCGVSIAPNMAGPSYIFGNVIYDLHYDGITAGSAVKAGGDGGSGRLGYTYVIGNTFDNIGHGMRNVGYGNSAEYHAFTRNNICVSESFHALSNKGANVRDDFDCDLIFGKRNVSFGEAHGIFDKRPVYVSRTDADFRLADGSPGKGAAVYLDNFNEIYGADMGAKQ